MNSSAFNVLGRAQLKQEFIVVIAQYGYRGARKLRHPINQQIYVQTVYTVIRTESGYQILVTKINGGRISYILPNFTPNISAPNSKHLTYRCIVRLSHCVIQFQLCMAVAERALSGKHVVQCDARITVSKDFQFYRKLSNHTPFRANHRHLWLKALYCNKNQISSHLYVFRLFTTEMDAHPQCLLTCNLSIS